MNRRWRIELLGDFRTFDNVVQKTFSRFSTRKTVVLLAYLALTETVSSRAELAALFWPDAETQEGRRSLGMALGDLRKNLSDENASLVLMDRMSAHLSYDDFTTDVSEMEAALQKARRAQTPETRIAALQTAISLYRGPFLSGFLVFGSDVAEEWAETKRRRLEIAYYDALREISTLLEAQGQREEALVYALRATELNSEDGTAREQALRLATARSREGKVREERPASVPPTSSSPPQIDTLITRTIGSLSKAARLLLVRLAVFGGGWTDQLAPHVLNTPVPPALHATLESALLIHSDPSLTPPRYVMPEAVREAAFNLLRPRQKRKILLAYVRRLVQIANPVGNASRYHAPPELLEANILAALDWALRAGNAPQLGVQLVLNRCSFWYHANNIETLRFWLQCALEQELRLSPSARFQLHYALGNLWHYLYEQAAARRHFDAALQYAKTLERQEQIARAFDALGKAAHHQEQDAEACAAFEAGLSVCSEDPKLRSVQACLASDYAEALAVQGETERASDLYCQSLVLAETVDDADLLASAAYRFAELLHERGNMIQAQTYINQSLERWQVRNEDREIAACFRLLGALHLDQGHFGEARFFLERSAEIFAAYQRDECRAATLGWLGELERRTGQLEAAARYYQEGLDIWQRKSHQRWCAIFQLRQACLAYHQGADVLAAALCVEAEERCPGTHALKTRAGILRLQARLAVRQRALEEAQIQARESLALFSRVQNGAGMIEALETQAEVLLLTGDRETAFRLFSEARTKREAIPLPVPPVEALAYRALQKRLSR